ncbi:MAG: alpha amylase catalytic region, partial [Geminicoccaceae bacterium]|nr:alpha amylase catalytic region [Geminicoccaceae bacterium]
MTPGPTAHTSAQAPTVAKVEPPNWWAGHSINPVRLLVRGTNLGAARVQCPRLRCGTPKVNARGSYAFIDVTIPAGTRPGSYPLTVRTSAGTVSVPFTVSAPLARPGRFQGFGLDDVIYLIMPDRFANGDTTNDRPAKSPGLIDRQRARYYHGGDLAGIHQRLPYLDSLGVTALWFNPVYDNNDRLNEREVYDGQPITDYHGYGAVDFYGVDEHFGTMAELRRLVDDAHRSGIKIILDMVANHT